MPKDAVAHEVAELAREFVRDAVHEASEKAVDTQIPHPSFTSQEAGHVNELFSRVPPDQGWYFKVYKRYPVPEKYGNRPVFLLDIQQPELIADVESELQRLAKQHEWGDGIYEIRKFQTGKSGQQGSTQVTIQVPRTLPPDPGNGTTASTSTTADPFASVRTTASLIKELQNAAPGTAPDAIAKAVSDTVKTIVESTKTAPAAPPVDLAGIVNALKGLMPPPMPPKAPEDLLSIIVKLQPLLNPPRPASSDASVIDTIIKLKTAGLLGPEPQADPTNKALELIGNLLPLVQSMAGGDRGETSFGVELVRALGPQVGKIVSDVTDTINKVVTSKAGAPPATRPAILSTPAPSMPEIEQTLPPESAPAPIILSEEGTPMLPLFKPIKEAVERRDRAFFPVLEQTLMMYGAQAYEQLLSGTITIENVITYVKPFGAGFLDSDHGRAYLNEFLTWAKAQKGQPMAGKPSAEPGMAPVAPITPSSEGEPEPFIVAKCDECGEVYEYDSQETFDTESKCEDCYTQLTIVGGTHMNKGREQA